MVGFRDIHDFKFPSPVGIQKTMSDILEGDCNKKIGYTLRVGGRSSPIHDRRNWDSYLVDNRIVQINSKHGLKMQGFPEDFIFPVSETQAMKQLGNSVAVPAIQAVAQSIVERLACYENANIRKAG